MKNLIKSKCSQGPLSITLMVIATLVLCVTALFIFAFKTSSSEQKLDVSEIEKFYSRAEIINFYLDRISLKIRAGSDPSQQFKKELERYKDEKGIFFDSNLRQIENQLNEDPSKHVYFDSNNKLIIDFEITLLELIYPSDPTKPLDYEVKYSYNYHKG